MNKVTLTIYLILFMVMLVGVSATNILWYEFEDDFTDSVGSLDASETVAVVDFEAEYPTYLISGDGATKCASFDGDDAYLTINSDSNLLEGVENFSISVWIKPDSGTPDISIASKYAVTNKIVMASSDLFYFQMVNGANDFYESYDITQINSTSTWYHIVLVLNGTASSRDDALKMYIDGVELSESGAAGTVPFTTPTGLSDMNVGVWSETAGYLEKQLDGNMDELKIFDEVLGQDEIDYLRNYGIAETQVVELKLTMDTPPDNTNVNVPTDITFNLTDVNGSADCILNHQERGYYLYQYGLGDGTHSFNFDSSYWDYDTNRINITCNDSSSSDNGYITLYVDTTLPIIKKINYKRLGLYSTELNGKIIYSNNITFDIVINDTNLYSYNFTITRSGFDDIYYYNDSENLSVNEYTINPNANLDSFSNGWYTAKVSVKDAHTLTNVDFNSTLIDKDIIKIGYIGKVFDDKIRGYGSNLEINKFDTTQTKDRKMFEVSFLPKITKFDIYVEGNKIVYLGDKYGYEGHFILDDHYWMDFENRDGAKVTGMTRINDHKVKVSLTKPYYVNKVLFKSIGIINEYNESVQFYYDNLNTNNHVNLTTFIDGKTFKTYSYSVPGTKHYFINLPMNIDVNEAYFSLIPRNTTTDYNSPVDNVTTDATIHVTTTYYNYTKKSDLANVYTSWTNIAVPLDCKSNNISIKYVSSGTGQEDLYCYNYSSDSYVILITTCCTGGSYSYLRFFDVNNFDPKFYLGNLSDTFDYNFSGILRENVTTLNITTKVNSIISNNCSCINCSQSNSICSIPINIYNGVPGEIELRDIYIGYDYKPTNLTINLYDTETLELITNTEVVVQLIGSIYQFENYTNTGIVNFTFPFNSLVTEQATIRVYSRNITDYSIVIRNLNFTAGDVSKVVDLYLTNTSNLATTNLVTFYVYDEDYSTLEGATIHIELQNPSTNTYLPITSLTTNSNGQATTILATDTFFYRWYVDYKGKEIYRLNAPVSLSLNDDLIYIVGVIEEKYSDEVTQILDNYVDLHFNTTSNITGFFEVDYNMVDPVEMCIYVYIHNQSGTYLNTTSCENATFGTLQTGILTPSNRTYYVSFAKVDFKDGEGYIIMDTSSGFLGRDGKVLTKSQGLFILIILTLASVMGFIASPIIGLIIFMVGVIGISLMPFIVGFKIGTAMIMVSLALITAVTISRLKK